METNITNVDSQLFNFSYISFFISSDGEEETVMNDLMVDWFTLIRNKQVYMRRESELVYMYVQTVEC